MDLVLKVNFVMFLCLHHDGGDAEVKGREVLYLSADRACMRMWIFSIYSYA